MNKHRALKIIIFDGSFKTTPFITRLVRGLLKNHQLYILGFNEKLSQPIAGVHYISLGSNQNKLKFLFTTLQMGIRSKKFDLLLPTLQKLLRGDRQALQQQNLDLALNTIAPDIIHLQWPSVLPWFERVLIQQKIPVILSQRGFHNNVRPFVDEENFGYLQKWYPNIAGFHSVSKAMATNGDKIWNSFTKLNKVVYTGLPLDEFLFVDEYIQSTPLQLLSIGRPHWIKGYNYALHCCKFLKDKNVPFKYTIVGGAGDEELQFLISNLDLQGGVILESRKPQSEVYERMRQASLLLMPSIEEGIPNVVVEAMALGLPVISTTCGGVSELISHTVEGWLVPTRDALKMADAIATFAQLSREKIDEVRLAARRKIEMQHSEDHLLEGMEQLYREVLLKKKVN